MNTLERIKEVALEVREWAEEDYGQRNQKPSLCGHCAIASAELYKRLKAAGVNAEIRMAEADMCSHVFLVADDYVIDVTATQFSEFRYEPVVIMHEREAQQHWFYSAEQTFPTPTALRRYQVKAGWPQDQIARR